MADMEHYWIDWIVCPILFVHAAFCAGLITYLKIKRWPVRHEYDWSTDTAA